MDGWTSVLVRTERGGCFQRSRPKLTPRPRRPGGPRAARQARQADRLRSLQREFDPDAPLFIDYEEHLRNYEGTDRRPVLAKR